MYSSTQAVVVPFKSYQLRRFTADTNDTGRRIRELETKINTSHKSSLFLHCTVCVWDMFSLHENETERCCHDARLLYALQTVNLPLSQSYGL
jgi:hypothetical protein